MIHILSIETSGTNCSVAISENGRTIALKETNDGKYSHGENLHLYINEVLKKINLPIKNLHAVAISQGPGSYTGIRIGMASAKGLCFALNIPLIAIPTLQVLSREVDDNQEDSLIIPMIDARRMEVYTTVYTHSGENIEKTQPLILTEDSFTKYKDKKVIFLGDGSEKFKKLCTLPHAKFISNKFPSAEKMGKIAFEKYQKKQFENISLFEPSYLK